MPLADDFTQSDLRCIQGSYLIFSHGAASAMLYCLSCSRLSVYIFLDYILMVTFNFHKKIFFLNMFFFYILIFLFSISFGFNILLNIYIMF